MHGDPSHSEVVIGVTCEVGGVHHVGVVHFEERQIGLVVTLSVAAVQRRDDETLLRPLFRHHVEATFEL